MQFVLTVVWNVGRGYEVKVPRNYTENEAEGENRRTACRSRINQHRPGWRNGNGAENSAQQRGKQRQRGVKLNKNKRNRSTRLEVVQTNKLPTVVFPYWNFSMNIIAVATWARYKLRLRNVLEESILWNAPPPREPLQTGPLEMKATMKEAMTHGK